MVTCFVKVCCILLRDDYILRYCRKAWHIVICRTLVERLLMSYQETHTSHGKFIGISESCTTITELENSLISLMSAPIQAEYWWQIYIIYSDPSIAACTEGVPWYYLSVTTWSPLCVCPPLNLLIRLTNSDRCIISTKGICGLSLHAQTVWKCATAEAPTASHPKQGLAATFLTSGTALITC